MSIPGLLQIALYAVLLAALAFHNWVSSAAGIAVAIALVRGLARRSGRSIGNFWVDMVRGTLYVLLPIGILLYELLTGRVPYPVDDALEAMRRKVETDPPLVRRLRAEVPPPLEAVIYRALRRNPQERYQSMAALRHDLAHLDTVRMPIYRPDVPPPRSLGDLPRLRTTARILLVVFTVLAACAVLAELAHRALPPR